MRIVYVTAQLPYSGGETFLIPEVEHLEALGHDVLVVPVRPRRSVHPNGQHLSAVRRGLASPLVVMAALSEALRAPRRVLRVLGVLVHSRSQVVLLKNLAVLPKALWLGRFTRRNGFEHLHAHFASTSATVAMAASAFSGVAWSFTAHRWDIFEDNLLAEKARTAAFVRSIDRRGAAGLVALAGTDPPPPRVIHLGVRVQAAPPVRAVRANGSLRVVLAARYAEVKGHLVAVEAVDLLRARGIAVVLECFGEGPLRPTVVEAVRARRLEASIRCNQALDHDVFLRDLAAGRWDVAILPSIETARDWEGIPATLIEAMAAGVPVISTTTGGVPELVGGGAGLLVPPGDAVGLADALQMLREPDLQADLAARGWSRVREAFAVDATAGALADLITSSPRPSY